MLRESVDILEVNPRGVYVDATLGGGGHSRAILSRLGPEGRLICLDMDSDAISNAPDDSRVTAVRTNFRFIHNHIRRLGHDRAVDGILADLGVSSHQFDTPERGFSFRFDAPLDMRMNTSAGESAADLLNTCDQGRLADILHIYGEVDNSRRTAALICAARQKGALRTTADLNAAVQSILPPVAPHKTLARIYQALRIEVNGEMRSLEHLLSGIARSLRPGGIAAIITYHSLEDRMVKNFFRCGNISGRQESPGSPSSLPKPRSRRTPGHAAPSSGPHGGRSHEEAHNREHSGRTDSGQRQFHQALEIHTVYFCAGHTLHQHPFRDTQHHAENDSE